MDKRKLTVETALDEITVPVQMLDIQMFFLRFVGFKLKIEYKDSEPRA